MSKEKDQIANKLLYAISKTSSRTIELTVLQKNGRTLRLENKLALMLAQSLIDHVLR